MMCEVYTDSPERPAPHAHEKLRNMEADKGIDF
jgi:hypothetical protein